MTISLGLDIGSNSVGSAWVDTEKQEVHLGVSVFPAGVDEQENKRGAPKNLARRETRSQRRNIHRRAERKRRLRRFLTDQGLLPAEPEALRKLFDVNPWDLRRRALHEVLHPHEFGRIIVHLAQRRGALGIETDPDEPEEGKVKDGINRLKKALWERDAETVGALLAELMTERQGAKGNVSWHEPIRNRQYRTPDAHQLFAGRDLIREEFHLIVERQRAHDDSSLAPLLTDELVRVLDDPHGTDTWRHRGLLFGQRRTYWDSGTLGRCDLEPTERCAPLADMHAQAFRVVETANNIRITKRGELERALTSKERNKVIDALRRQKTGSVAPLRKALGIHKKAVKEFYSLNVERDEGREINTDWFYREIVHGAVTEERWESLDVKTRESLNRALLRFDPDRRDHVKKLRRGAERWWGLDSDAADKLVVAWRARPRLEKRIRLSRTAVRNLLPYMNEFDEDNGRWPTQIEARVRFAEDLDNGATHEQRTRYGLGIMPLCKRDRQYLRKHGEPLPPAPMLSNPVVRKSIHEVRRHIIAWWRRFGRTPDQIVIEYVRSATQPAKVRTAALLRNRKREGIRKTIIEDHQLDVLSSTQQRRAIERVLLCRQQRGVCAYSGRTISEKAATEGSDVESDHIVPKSRSQDNGLNNKVLVTRESNRGKGNKTVTEWMSQEQFSAMEQRLAHLEKGESADEYFTKKDCGRKWENLHRDAPATADFLSSQLTDSAYAAKQVGQWLREALYEGEREGRRRVFTTKGAYTAILRNDWGLSEGKLDREWHDIADGDGTGGDDGPCRARKDKGKDRTDHIHHAIDAVCIALTNPQRIKNLAMFMEDQERARADIGSWPRRRALLPPWPKLPDNPTKEQADRARAKFRQQIVDASGKLVVGHRPVKRRLVGSFHEETHYGPVLTPLPAHRTEAADTLFTNRISAAKLTPRHLRVAEGWEDLSIRLDDDGVPSSEKAHIRRERAALPDPSPEKSGIVRDRALRDRIRRCLREEGLTPEAFTSNEIKQLVSSGRLTMNSGVPIKRVTLLRTIADPVIIARKQLDTATGKMVAQMDPRDPTKPDPRSKRTYIGGNNHHVEIREQVTTRNGKQISTWNGVLVTAFEAAQRVRGRKASAVDRSDNAQGRFIMSLAEGELLYGRRKDRPEEPPTYYVVCKLDKPCRIYVAPHWDARVAGNQDRWSITPKGLKDCGPEPGNSPYKVWVSALGETRRLEKD